MAALRTIFAVLIAVSVAMLPAAGAAAFKLQPQEPAEMSASEPMHDCCPPTANPCDKAGDCASMATCALPCCIYPGAGASPLVYPTMHADVMPLLASDALPSHMGSPPFRPPRA
jgi:hypothetical protein